MQKLLFLPQIVERSINSYSRKSNTHTQLCKEFWFWQATNQLVLNLNSTLKSLAITYLHLSLSRCRIWRDDIHKKVFHDINCAICIHSEEATNSSNYFIPNSFSITLTITFKRLCRFWRIFFVILFWCRVLLSQAIPKNTFIWHPFCFDGKSSAWYLSWSCKNS